MKMTVGCAAAMIGFCMYSHTKIVSLRQQQAKLAVQAMEEDMEVEAQPLKGKLQGD